MIEMFACHKISFITEQVGLNENDFKKELIILFKHQLKKLRAYLCQITYDKIDKIHVALCIYTEADADKLLINEVYNIFAKMFSADEHLDIIFLNNNQEFMLRKVCCPFYSTPRYRYHIPDFF